MQVFDDPHTAEVLSACDRQIRSLFDWPACLAPQTGVDAIRILRVGTISRSVTYSKNGHRPAPGGKLALR